MTVTRGAIGVVASAILAITLVGTTVSVAGALSLAPTDWRSTLISVAPFSDAFTVELYEGGEAIRITVSPGHMLTVPGYANEPYLRVTEDGTVEVNTNSPTWWSNRSVSGTDSAPTTVSANAAPEWRRIGDGGAVTWHDHRIHAMPGVDDDTDWNLTFTIDGLPHVARGRLTRLPDHSPVPEIVLSAILATGAILLGRRHARRSTSIALGIAAMIAVAIATGEATTTPAGMDLPMLHLVVAVAAFALTTIAVAIGRRSRHTSTLVLPAAIAALAWWWALMLPAATAAIVPNLLVEPIIRIGLAIVLALDVAAAVLVIMSGAFTDDADRPASPPSTPTTQTTPPSFG